MPTLLILAIPAVIVVFVIIVYNSLAAKRANVRNAFAGIDVQLKKRCDLVPNLVSSVKVYMQHESGTLEKLTELRTRAASATDPAERLNLDKELSGALKALMVQVEAYPDLKASANVEQLQRSLNEIEEQISASRRAYNAAVTDYNIAIRIFPNNLLAGMFGHTEAPLYEAAPEDRANPNTADLFHK
ncbi:MAG: LemA family protein [Lentisphaeria bacterium]|nr:LemA family protein [Lentisphaeria bacterium]